MMRSMFSGVSGLQVHQTKMDVIANNIANVNTVGFKSSRVTFNEVFSQSISGASGTNPQTGKGGVNPKQIGLGAGVASIDKLMTKGASQRTDVSTDLMIDGNGFFVVGDGSGTYFTRAGAMLIDESGYLVTSGGLHVKGWDASIDKDPTSATYGETVIKKGQVTDVLIAGEKEYVTPKPTTRIDFSGNLNAATDPVKQNTVKFYDDLGNFYTADVTWTHTPDSTPSEWIMSFDADEVYLNGDNNTPVAVTGLTGTTITQTFDIYGLPETPTQTTGIVITPVTALVPASQFEPLTIDTSGLTQFGNSSASAISIPKDGNAPGKLSGVSFSGDGKIYGSYSNGDTKILGQIPVAIFANPAGLESVGNNLFLSTANSGDFDGIGIDVTAQGGKIQGGVLEMSNVSLSQEFTEMITTQRGFQANSRVITTSDEMLQELVNLKR